MMSIGAGEDDLSANKILYIITIGTMHPVTHEELICAHHLPLGSFVSSKTS